MSAKSNVHVLVVPKTCSPRDQFRKFGAMHTGTGAGYLEPAAASDATVALLEGLGLRGYANWLKGQLSDTCCP